VTDLEKQLLKALQAVRSQLWIRRFKFSDLDHEAMNKASSAISKAYVKATNHAAS